MNRFTRLFIITIVLWGTFICNSTQILGQSTQITYSIQLTGEGYSEDEIIDRHAQFSYKLIDKIPFKDFRSILILSKIDTAYRLRLPEDDEIMVRLFKPGGLPETFYETKADGSVRIKTLPVAIVRDRKYYYVKMDIWGMEKYDFEDLLNQLARNGYYYDGHNNDLNQMGKPWRYGKDIYYTAILGQNKLPKEESFQEFPPELLGEWIYAEEYDERTLNFRPDRNYSLVYRKYNVVAGEPRNIEYNVVKDKYTYGSYRLRNGKIWLWDNSGYSKGYWKINIIDDTITIENLLEDRVIEFRRNNSDE